MPKPTPVALIGELLATQVMVKQAAGILVNAAVRDVAELVELGLPIWTRFIRVRGATKTRIGEVNTTVTVGGTQISPGILLFYKLMAAFASNANAWTKCLKHLKKGS